MPAEILDGKAIAKQIQAETKQKVADFVANGGPQPKLAAVLVGEDPASQVYVRNKERACKRAGIASELVRMPARDHDRAVANESQRAQRRCCDQRDLGAATLTRSN